MYDISRRAALVLAIATSALAATTSSALAAEPIEYLEDIGNTVHCGTLASGHPCNIHAEGELTLRTHFFGVEAQEARCNLEFEAISDEDGNMRLTVVIITNGGHGESNCPTVSPPCSGSLPWPGTSEEIASGVAEAHFDVCIDPAEFTTCSGEFLFRVNEDFVFDELHLEATDNRIGTAFCEIDTDTETESSAPHDELRTNHP